MFASKASTLKPPKREKCHTCSLTVYAMERIPVEGGLVFHPSCFRCTTCNQTLTAFSYSRVEEKFYCEAHGQKALRSVKVKKSTPVTPRVQVSEESNVEENSIKQNSPSRSNTFPYVPKDKVDKEEPVSLKEKLYASELQVQKLQNQLLEINKFLNEEMLKKLLNQLQEEYEYHLKQAKIKEELRNQIVILLQNVTNNVTNTQVQNESISKYELLMKENMELAKQLHEQKKANEEMKKSFEEKEQKMNKMMSDMMLRLTQYAQRGHRRSASFAAPGAQRKENLTLNIEKLKAPDQLSPKQIERRGSELVVSPQRKHTKAPRSPKALQPLDPKPFYMKDYKEIQYTETTGDQDCWETSSEGEKYLSAATLERLIEILTSPTEYDPHFLHTFMITFRSFMDGKTLFEKLEERFNIPPPKDCTHLEFAEFKKDKLDRVRLRVTQTIKHWLEGFFKFDFDEENLQRLEKMIDMMHKSNASALAKMLQNTLDKMKSNDTSGIIQSNLECPPIQYPKKRFAISKTMKKVDILDWPSIEIARQITLIDYNMFVRIEPKECLDKNWNKENRDQMAPNIAELTNWFNKLCFWIGTVIVQTTELDQRVKILEKVIRIADDLLSLNNFNSFLAVMSALNLASIHRLRKTWDALKDKTKKKYEALNKLTAADKNRAALRAKTKSVNPPCIPYIGLYLTDLLFVEEGNPKYVQKNNLKMINFTRCRGFAQIIRDLQTFQNTRYALKEEPELKEMLLSVTFISEDEMYAKSLEVEPRKNGGKCENKTNENV